MSAQDIEMMTDTVVELDLPQNELRLFTLRLPMLTASMFILYMRQRHGIEIFV